MAIEELVKQVAATFERDGSSQAIFGPAFELEHHKIIPVAVVLGGAGGGGAEGGGGGVGFAVNVRPVGFIHESGEHVVFTPIHVDPRYRSASSEVAAFGLRRAIELFSSFLTHFQQRRTAKRFSPRPSAPLDASEVTSPS